MLFNLGAHQKPLCWFRVRTWVCVQACAPRGCNSASSIKACLLAWHSACAPALPPCEVVGSGQEEAFLNQVYFWMCFIRVYGDVAPPCPGLTTDLQDLL